jgi:hypothetical protein
MPSIDAVAGLRSISRKRFDASLCWVVLLAVITACETPLGPLEPLPSSALRFDPPEQYLSWWRLTEACSGRTHQPEGIKWYVVPMATSFATSSGSLTAQWSRGSDGARIVISGAYQSSEMVVRHEMLHALLDRGDHPSQYFIDRCHLTWSSWAG